MRGRVMALYAIAFLGSTPIGGPIVGWISQQYGAAARLRDRRGRDDRRDGVGRLVAAAAPRGAAGDADVVTMRAAIGRGLTGALLLVVLDGVGVARRRRVGIEAELAAGPALPEQVPALVERDFELLQPGRVVLGRLLRASALRRRAR